MNNNQTKSIVSAISVLLVSVLGMFGLTIEEGTAEIIATGALMLGFIIYGIVRDHNFKPVETVGQKAKEAVIENAITEEQLERIIEQVISNDGGGKHLR